MANFEQLSRDMITTFGNSNWEGMKALLTPDAVYSELASNRNIQGADAIMEVMKGWKQAFPDAKGTVSTVHVAGNIAIVEVTWKGTHTGPMEGPGGTIPPSGNSQTTPGALINVFQGDKIKETRHYFDMLSLMQQIGAIPAATT